LAADEIIVRLEGSEVAAKRTLNASGSTDVELSGMGVFEARPLGTHMFRVKQGEKTWLVYAIANGDRRWVFLEGQVLVVEVRNADSRRYQKSGVRAHELTAPMPATVAKILVAEGQKVARGDILIVLEAMKMELPIKAPADGTVNKIMCQLSQLVQPDTPLLDFK
jgi:biotin carboxyl carrier protein